MNPRPFDQRPTPWTISDVHDLIESDMRNEENVAVQFLSSLNEWQERLVESANTAGWGSNEIGLLAMSAILDEIARFCRREADSRVKEAREKYATTWANAAKALGYSTPNALARRVDPVQREESNRRNRELRERKRQQAFPGAISSSDAATE